jgi:REP element-mobilizing transposase RayT
VKEYQSQSHVRYECKYHIVWCPKYRRKKLYGRLRHRFGEIMHDLCRQKGIDLIEGHACPDHVHHGFSWSISSPNFRLSPTCSPSRNFQKSM